MWLFSTTALCMLSFSIHVAVRLWSVRPKAVAYCWMFVRIVPRQERSRPRQMQLFNLYYFVCCSLLFCPLFRCLVSKLCLLAADAALKEEHVIDGRTIDVKRAVPRDRAPMPRLVRVMGVVFSCPCFAGRFGDFGCRPGVRRKYGAFSVGACVRSSVNNNFSFLFALVCPSLRMFWWICCRLSGI